MENAHPQTGILLLAAGASTRMGQAKQLLRIASLATSRSELDDRLSAVVDACLSERPTARPTARVVVDTLRELGAPTPLV